MKRAIRVLTVILVVLEAVLPCGKWGLQLIGYTLEPFSYVGYAWLLAVISAVVLFLRLFKKDESDGVLCVFLMPLSLLDALAYTSFFRTSSLHPQKSAWTAIALLICVLCSASITPVFGKNSRAERFIAGGNAAGGNHQCGSRCARRSDACGGV